MKKQAVCIFVILLFAVTLIPALTGFSEATEPMPDYTVRGRTFNLPIIIDGEGEVVAVSRGVVFNADSFPLAYDKYDNGNFQDYATSVNATTVYQNVSDKDAVVRACVYVGTQADKFSLFGEFYSVVADGAEAEGKDRYAYRGKYSFDNDEKTISSLNDERRTDGRFDANTVVTEYVYRVACDTDGEFELFVTADTGEDLAFFAEGEKHLEGDDFIIYRINAKDGDEIKCYAVGGDTNIEFVAEKDAKELNCVADMVVKRESGLSDFADGSCVIGDSESARVDWFNLLTDYLEDGISDKDSDPFTATEEFAEKYVALIKEYGFEVKAGDSVSCGYSAPLFPHIDENYEPNYYRYEFSAEKNGESADGCITQYIIKTPYCLTGLPGAEKTEEGYEFKDESTSVCFSLCAEENPEFVGIVYSHGEFYSEVFFASHVIWCVEAFLVICFAVANVAEGAKRGVRGEDLMKRAARAIGICIASLAIAALFTFISLYCVHGAASDADIIVTIVASEIMSAAVTAADCGLLIVKKRKNDGTGEQSDPA